MERELQSSPLIHGFGLPDSSWEWLLPTLNFCVDFEASPPREVSGWCLQPFVGAYSSLNCGLGVNAFGPGLYTQNTPVTAAADMLTFTGDVYGVTTGTEGVKVSAAKWNAWTVALGFQRRQYSTYSVDLLHLYSGAASQDWRLRLGPAGTIVWDRKDIDYVSTATGAADANANGPAQTVAVATMYGRFTNIFLNGKLAASATWGSALDRWNQLYIAGGYAQKKQYAFSGVIGPFLISQHAWSESEARQFHGNPWGFAGPSWVREPIRSSIEFEARTLPAVEGDTRQRAAIDDPSIGGFAAIEGDSRSKPAVEGEERTQPAVEGDARTRSR